MKSRNFRNKHSRMAILELIAGINFCEWEVLIFFLLGNGSKRNLFLDLFLNMFQKYIYIWNKLSRIVKFGFQKGINFRDLGKN